MAGTFNNNYSEDSTSSSPTALYPFVVRIEAKDLSVNAKALKLVQHGLMLELGQGVLGVGEEGYVKFDLPEDLGFIESPVKVIKIYDRKVPSKEGVTIQRIVEVHFSKRLDENSKLRVKRFLKAARQVGAK